MLLLIPGPVTTRPEVRAAMAQDIAPWDNDTRPIWAGIRARVLGIAGGDPAVHAALPLQGCGHFAVEASIRSMLPPAGKLLVPMAGHYAERMVHLAREADRVPIPLPVSQTEPVDPAAIAAALAADPDISHVGLVYSETSSGVVADVAAIGRTVRALGRRVIVDAVSAFGALPLDMTAQSEIDAVVFTSNKCLEGLPGIGFVVARVDRLLPSAQVGSWSFDLGDIHRTGLSHGPGTFRFTPPAQVLAALGVAIDIHAAEGGQPARLARYKANAATLYDGMLRIGLHPCLDRAAQGPIVMNVRAPIDPAWTLQGFVDGLKAHGFLISNFYNTPDPSFRVGCIGAVTPDDMRRFVAATDAVLREMGITIREPTRQAA